MQTVEPTLKERAGRMYRQLLLLQRVFQLPREPDDVEWFASGDRARDLALCVAIRELIDELTEHAGILTSIPFPVSEWRPGDGPDDERWRALTEIERREVLSMISGYENLISWSEQIARPVDFARRVEPSSGDTAAQLPGTSQKVREATDYLKAERVRVGRFRQEMGFLERRRIAG